MTINDTQKLKSLQVRLSKSLAKLTELEKDKRQITKECDREKSLVIGFEKEIKKLAIVDIVVSEHAVIRFLERAMGFDMEQIKQKILNDNLKDTIKSMGNGEYPICEGLRVIVKNGVVLTVV